MFGEVCVAGSRIYILPVENSCMLSFKNMPVIIN